MIELSRTLELKRDQIMVLVAKDFKLKYDATALGMLWAMIIPLLMSAVYYFVFGVILNLETTGGPFALYLICGNFLWHFFSSVVMQNGNVLMGNAALLKKTSFDRRLLIWGTFFTESIHFLLTMPILFGIMIAFGVKPDWLTFFPNVLAVIFSMMFFSVGFSYLYAALNLYFRDLQRIMSVVMMIWLYASFVFIPVSRIPEKWFWICDVNPVAVMIRVWRDAFFAPAFEPWLYLNLAVSSIIMFFVGRYVFRRFESRFATMM